MEKLEESEILKLELLETQLSLAQAQLELLNIRNNTYKTELQKKYKIQDGDSVDLKTYAIIRGSDG